MDEVKPRRVSAYSVFLFLPDSFLTSQVFKKEKGKILIELVLVN